MNAGMHLGFTPGSGIRHETASCNNSFNKQTLDTVKVVYSVIHRLDSKASNPQ